MDEKDNKKKPNPTDIYVGSKIRQRRNVLGMSQERLGESLGITFQQIQKYEKGTNRVGASRLLAIASTLDVPVAFFFADEAARAGTAGDAPPDAGSPAFGAAIAGSAEGLQLSRAFARIAEPKVRRKLIELVKALASDAGD